MDGGTERDAGDGFGQRLITMDYTGPVGCPVPFKGGGAMAHDYNAMHFGFFSLQLIYKTVGIPIRDANR